MIRLPSFHLLFNSAQQTFKRFPLALLAAMVAALISARLVDQSSSDLALIRLLFAALLGIPLFIISTLVGERTSSKCLKSQAALNSLGLLVLGFYYFFTFKSLTTSYYIRFLQLNLGLHLLVAVVLFIPPGQINGFWQFNKQLFLRLLSSVFYAVVFFVGTTLALFAIDYLFEIKIDSNIYSYLWIFSAFILMTWRFLAGVPSEFARLEQEHDYPKGLKIFTQFLLIPLVTVYLVILYFYLAKIGLTRVWPKGVVGWLVSGVSVLGILNLLLVYPLSKESGTQWIKTYSRAFYLSLLPLLGLLAVAIYRRVDTYGFTEPRYFLLALALWLTLMVIYFGVMKGTNIKYIPLWLSGLAFLTAFGPWGAYSVSEYSQTHRLVNLLTKNNLLEGGKAKKATIRLPFGDRREISSVINYLVKTHGPKPLERFFDKSVLDETAAYENKVYSYWGVFNESGEAFVHLLGFDYVAAYGSSSGENLYFSADPTSENGLVVTGYDVMLTYVGKALDNFEVDGKKYQLDVDGDFLRVWMEHKLLCKFNLSKMVADIQLASLVSQNQKVSPPLLQTEIDMTEVKVKLILDSLSVEEMDDKRTVQWASGKVLLKLK